MPASSSKPHAFQEAGTGIVYFPGLEHLIEPHLSRIGLIEIEPQTLWIHKDASGHSFGPHPAANERLLSYPVPKLFHGVGYPVAGSQLPDEAHFKVLNDHIGVLQPLWISEHLSFNAFMEGGRKINTSFLLPQLQTEAGVAAAVAGIRHYRSKVDLPFAFETGVNYLRPRAGELEDGCFVARIAEEADCHILLDVHNIMANQLNGRQTVEAFMRQLPLSRIAEIHIAGGFFYHQYYIDAHSGCSSDELFGLLEKIVRSLPGLKALVFEMLPDYADAVSVADLGRQLERMQAIWDLRGKDAGALRHALAGPSVTAFDEQSVTVQEWEYTLGKTVLDQEPEIFPEALSELRNDPGIGVIRELVFHFRASAIVTSLKLTTRLLRLQLGEAAFETLLQGYFRVSAPQLFAYETAKDFAAYLSLQSLALPYLDSVLAFELSTLHTTVDNQPRRVSFDFNPFPVFRSLTQNKLPEDQDTPMQFILEIKPDEQVSDAELMGLRAVYHT